ncbi:MAG TPA: hypothetical protein VFS72_01560 [Agromyces sp.]|jgi:hypothetical protein|nr:hypothetical protein [Agromyces sp.]
MWTDEHGDLHEEPVNWRETVVGHAVQAMVERLPDDARDRYSAWMDEELETLRAHARELVAGGLAEEAAYRYRPVPAVELQRVPWLSIRDRASLEAALRSVPPRWRLDVMFIVEDAFDANRPPKSRFRLRDLWDALNF